MVFARHVLLTLGFVVFTHISQTFATTCYAPDGSEVTDPAYKPCNQVVGATTMCCGTNRTVTASAPLDPDVCEPNGLCLGAYLGIPVYWRAYCTDKSWDSPECLQNVCTIDTEEGSSSGLSSLTHCSDGSWCCGVNNNVTASCCDDHKGFSLAAVVGQASSSSSIASSTSSILSSTIISSSSTASSTVTASVSSITKESQTTTSSSATSSAATPTNTSNNGAPASSKNGVTIGLGVGIPVVAILAVLVTFFWFRKRKQNKAQDYAVEIDNEGAAKPPVMAPREYHFTSPYYEPTPHYQEIDEGKRPPAELSSSKDGS